MKSHFSKLFIIAFLFISTITLGQNVTISGQIVDEENEETLISANVVIKGTTVGTVTDLDGNFQLMVEQKDTIVLQISYIGYETKTVIVTTNYNIGVFKLGKSFIPGQEVVITSTRGVSETILEAPISVQKMSLREIRGAASGDFYQSIGNMQGIDIITSSLGFKSINMRGFNTTMPVRMVQFVDGMDNQAPGLNFPIGNLVGASDIDLQSVEVISGAASALYGPNALQGVVSMTTKNPYDYQGLSVQVKGGSRDYMDFQGRFARSFGEKKKLAFKFVGSYASVEDWPATDEEANRYGDIETTLDLTKVLFDAVDDPETSPEDRDDYIKLTTGYLDFYSQANPGDVDVFAPGYDEVDMADYTSTSTKIQTSLHYRFKPDLELSYLYKYGLGTAVYQGTNRYSINNIKFQQHKIELTGKNFFVKAYTTMEDAGDSYDMVFTAINISKANIPDWVSNYLGEYFDVLDTLTNGFDDEARIYEVEEARTRAREFADANSWYEVGSHKFDSLYNVIINDPDLQTGSKFLDQSSLQHVEAQYQFDFLKDYLDLTVGATFRRYAPRSFGTIFQDTLANPADTFPTPLPDVPGKNDPDAEYIKISQYEFGGYLQASKKLLNDRLKAIFSLRFDKNQNYDLQVSPRGSLVYTYKSHNFRVSAQTAFRAPTLQNQYILIDLGPILLAGNLNGSDNLYTLESVDEFVDYYDTTYQIHPEILVPITLDPIKPEQVKTIEVGYRGVIKKKLYIDLSAYHNWYDDFIGNIRVVKPLNEAIAGEESGEDAIITDEYERFQIATNAKQMVKTYGFDIGVSYYLGKGFTVKGNYSYAQINDKELDDPIIPGFNTPNHKFNVGLNGINIWKGLGFNINYKWVDSVFWESTFGDGPVDKYNILDANLTYNLKKYYTTLTVGGSNITNQKYNTAYGSPKIGTMVYASLLFNLDRGKITNQ